MEEQRLEKRMLWKGALYGALAMFTAILILLAVIVKSGKVSLHTGGIDAKTAKKAAEIQYLIEDGFLYEDDLEWEELQEMSLKGYVAGLGDPYSVYYDTQETKELFEMTEGRYAGIGAVMLQDQETMEISIEEVYDDSPAKEAGMQKGDILLQVDEQDVTQMALSEVADLVKGEENSKVRLSIRREGEILELELTRKVVETRTVEAEMLNDRTGYLKITEFDTVIYDQFLEGMEKLESEGMKGLIVDLRDNPGGNLDTVCEILDDFLPEGTIVYTEDKNGNRVDTKTSDEEHQFTKPLVVLVNGESASASEVFTGAVQDYGIGTVIGTQTYGKGIVQTLYALSDGSCLKLTTAQYFTPNGRNIHEKGITPDLIQETTEDEKTDSQLEKALEIVGQEIDK